ncbi:MAG TPA: DNA polymerase I, partial [Phycisphaerae bacterium]|nr:DNA polymerase I [Phycisphaerae bacterium]
IPTMDWEAAKVHPERLPELAPLFQQLGFSRMTALLEQVVNQYRDMMPAGVKVAKIAMPASAPPPPRPVKERIAETKKKVAEIRGGLFDQIPEESTAADSPADAENESGGLLAAGEDGEGAPQVAGLQPVKGEYVLVNTAEKLDAMLATLREQIAESPQKWLAVDTETDALGSMQSNLCGISLSAKIGTGYYVAVKGAIEETLDPALVREKVGPLLADPAVKKVGQNIKYDLNALRQFGTPVVNVDFDTMIASYVIDSARLSHGMDALAADYLGLRPIPITDLIGKGAAEISFADVPLSRAAHYSAEDADVTLRLAHALQPLLNQQGGEKLFHEVEMPLVQVLADMEFDGVLIDTALLKRLSSEIEGKLVDFQKRIKAAAGGIDFNHDSPKQLADVLFKQLKLPVIKKTKTGPSTDITVLEKLADRHPVPALIVEYRQLTKLKNTYLDTLADLPSKKTGRVHSHFNQTGAETGRLSSSDPNLQNIPIKTELGREIRRAFVAGPGNVLLSADYSQIELRMLAHYCGEKALVEAFATHRDVHRLVAAELNHVPEEQVTPEMRAIAKTVNFGIIYGQTGFGLSQVLKIPKDQADTYINAYRRRFPAIEQFTHECIQEATAYGYVTTILGRRRTLPDITSPIQSRRQFSQRAALNSVIQGSAADLIKQAMVKIHQRLTGKSGEIRMLIQIHDELVFEVAAGKAKEWSEVVREEMEGAMALKVPVKVDLGTGPNWVDVA